MDFIWDGNHNLVHKTAWWWDGMPTIELSKTQVRMCVGRCRVSVLEPVMGYKCCAIHPLGLCA
jgi:hypothetical protein